ncbi:MAG: ABC transporter ATP-binding protein [Eubacteriales bacterium]|nr:ABC transporter ATP-binding protein [Eubacteriales bacterium]
MSRDSTKLLEVRNLSKVYGSKSVVKNLSFTLERAELLCILGPSGCGKSTILNCIGGFVSPTEGSILLNGEELNELPPEARKLSTVFQSYGLFPQFTVAQNVGYGLGLRRLAKPLQEEKIAAALKLVELSDYAERYPEQLSGGQRQRVALARSLVLEPQLLLLDEPLSNLDAKLRAELRGKIKEVQRSLGLAMIFVTHDQEEAFSLADRILLMNQGELVEAASPIELYTRPKKAFTLDFIGSANRRENQYLRYENVKILPGTRGEIVGLEFKGRLVEISIRYENEIIKALEIFDQKKPRQLGELVDLDLPWADLAPED